MSKKMEAIIQLRKDNPHWTLEKIGNFVGCTKMWSYTVLKQAGLPTVATKIKEYYYCSICHQPVVKRTRMCRPCRRTKVEIPCTLCHQLFEIPLIQYMTKKKQGQKNFYHNRSCYYQGRRDKL